MGFPLAGACLALLVAVQEPDRRPVSAPDPTAGLARIERLAARAPDGDYEIRGEELRELEARIARILRLPRSWRVELRSAGGACASFGRLGPRLDSEPVLRTTLVGAAGARLRASTTLDGRRVELGRVRFEGDGAAEATGGGDLPLRAAPAALDALDDALRSARGAALCAGWIEIEGSGFAGPRPALLCELELRDASGRTTFGTTLHGQLVLPADAAGRGDASRSPVAGSRSRLVRDGVETAAALHGLLEPFDRWRVRVVDVLEDKTFVELAWPRDACERALPVHGFRLRVARDEAGELRFDLGGVFASTAGFERFARMLARCCDPEREAVLVAFGDAERRTLELVLTWVGSIDRLPARSLRLRFGSAGAFEGVESVAVTSIERRDDEDPFAAAWLAIVDATGARTTVEPAPFHLCGIGVPEEDLWPRVERDGRRLGFAGGAVRVLE